MNSQIQTEIDNCYKNRQYLQQLICVVGVSGVWASTEYFVYYFDTFYKFSNIVKAIDICFKIVYT